MSTATFADYAFSPTLTPDATYTIELLIEQVREAFDPISWEEKSAHLDARDTAGYEPRFSREHIIPAETELKCLAWLSLQRLRSTTRPVRDLNAIRFLPELSRLVLTDNEIASISPLTNCAKLQELNIAKNPIRDIGALGSCTNLEVLNLFQTPVKDFAILQTLPRLKELTISSDHVRFFQLLDQLPSLRKIVFWDGDFESFAKFPQMPDLRVIQGAEVHSLEGLEKYPKLENLINLSGRFSSLEPLRNSKCLTHANILRSHVCSLEPLENLPGLASKCLD